MLFTNQNKPRTSQELIGASVKALIEALESGHSEVLTSYLNAMARFHYYSFGNILLIATQKQNASHVAGMYAWNQLGRLVRRCLEASLAIPRQKEYQPLRWSMPEDYFL